MSLTAAAATADVDALRDDLPIPQGADWGRAWPLNYDPPTDDPDQGPGPLDITGWVARAQARPSLVFDDDAPALFTWSNLGGVPGQIDLTAGWVTLLVAGVQSLTWPWRTARYDLWIKNAAGEPYLVAWGRINVIRTVTRW